MWRSMIARSFSAASHQPQDVAIIGGGIAGLSCSRLLMDKNYRVTTFDMGMRSPGGRACSREMPNQGLAFDHGAQFILPKSPEFTTAVADWERLGFIRQWSPRFGSYVSLSDAAATQNNQGENRGFLGMMTPGSKLYVGVPSNGSLARHLSQQVDIRQAVKVTSLQWDDDSQIWTLYGIDRSSKESIEQEEQELGRFRAVVIADALVAIKKSAGYVSVSGDNGRASNMLSNIANTDQIPVFTLMVAFDQPLKDIPFDVLNTSSSSNREEVIFDYIARNSSKPGRREQYESSKECWVAITSPDHAHKILKKWPLYVDGVYQAQTEAYKQGVANELLADFLQILNRYQSNAIAQPSISYVFAQRWGRAFTSAVKTNTDLVVGEIKMAACGDFAHVDSAEGSLTPLEVAWLSGKRAAEAIEQLLNKGKL